MAGADPPRVKVVPLVFFGASLIFQGFVFLFVFPVQEPSKEVGDVFKFVSPSGSSFGSSFVSPLGKIHF